MINKTTEAVKEIFNIGIISGENNESSAYKHKKRTISKRYSPLYFLEILLSTEEKYNQLRCKYSEEHC